MIQHFTERIYHQAVTAIIDILTIGAYRLTPTT